MSNHSTDLYMRLFRAFGLFALALVLMILAPGTALSNDALAGLPANCRPDAPKFAGITHCVLTAEKTHVILVNLETQGVRFETALSAKSNGQECKDVNTQMWAAPGRGCAPGPTYPFERVETIVKRYPDVRVAINGDYFGSDDHGHGAEGLTVKNGQRFDGWELGDCDGKPDRTGKTFDHKKPTPCDGNDVRRPSLTISRNNRVEIGYRTPQELDNKSTYTDRFYNAIGGGPLIVTGGKLLGNDGCNDPAFVAQRQRVCPRNSQSAVGLSNRCGIGTRKRQHSRSGSALSKPGHPEDRLLTNSGR